MKTEIGFVKNYKKQIIVDNKPKDKIEQINELVILVSNIYIPLEQIEKNLEDNND